MSESFYPHRDAHQNAHQNAHRNRNSHCARFRVMIVVHLFKMDRILDRLTEIEEVEEIQLKSNNQLIVEFFTESRGTEPIGIVNRLWTMDGIISVTPMSFLPNNRPVGSKVERSNQENYAYPSAYDSIDLV